MKLLPVNQQHRTYEKKTSFIRRTHPLISVLKHSHIFRSINNHNWANKTKSQSKVKY